MTAPWASHRDLLPRFLLPHRARVAFGVVVCTLLLIKAFVPLLASTAAQLRGQPVAEICSVYGVVLTQPAGEFAPPASPTDGTLPVPEPDAPSAAAHGGDHCPLSALAFLVSADAPPPRWMATRPADAPATPPHFDAIADAVSRWVARMKHGPPARA